MINHDNKININFEDYQIIKEQQLQIDNLKNELKDLKAGLEAIENK